MAASGNCDLDPTNGCEVSLGTNAAHCGWCDSACSDHNGTPDCEHSACSIACNTGFGDCDLDVANGCEANTQTDPAHCGGCGVTCAASEMCVAGACQTRPPMCSGITACTPGDGCCPPGCNANNDNDCEPRCGNMVKEGNETCDGDCPTTCNPRDACTPRVLTGSAAQCTAQCVEQPITACISGDGCCPPGCTADSECGLRPCSEVLAGGHSIAAGGNHTCARLSTGQVKCWGSNNHGQLGDGTMTGSTAPATVDGISNAVEVAAGWQHTCAVLGSGHIKCWGSNYYGQLGDGTRTGSAVPVQIAGITDAVGVTAGSNHTCVRLKAGDVLCWGLGDERLGDGSVVNAAGVSAGNYHTCAVLSTGSVQCWGSGRLGDGTNASSRAPVAVAGLGSAVEVDAGGFHTRARLGPSQIRCWGDNGYGQLGDGTTTASTAPVAVTGLNNAVEVAAGTSHTCARLDTARVTCWGRLSSLPPRTTPATVGGLSGVIEIAAGDNHMCARLSSGEVKCWGKSYSATPVLPVTGLTLESCQP